MKEEERSLYLSVHCDNERWKGHLVYIEYIVFSEYETEQNKNIIYMTL